MSARFLDVSGFRARVLPLACLGIAVAVSCSVFPDEATLPASVGGAGLGGEGAGSAAGPSGAAGSAEPAPNGGAPEVAGAAGGGGAATEGGSGGAPNGGASGASGGATAGAAGDSGACAPVSVPIGLDTWIDSEKPKQPHGRDTMLSVLAGPIEHRLIVQFTLPAAPKGATLTGATLSLHLDKNGDAAQVERVLGLHRLSVEVGSNSTWLYSTDAMAKWQAPGGDFGSQLAELSIPSGTSNGTFAFDIASLVRSALAKAPLTLSLIVLEAGTPPASAGELTFSSIDKVGSAFPAIVLDYCSP